MARTAGCLLGVLFAALLSASPAFAVDRVYWAGYGNDKISFANLDGSGGGGDLNTTGATTNPLAGIAVWPAGGKVFWANNTPPTISFAKLDGSGGGGDLNTNGATVNGPEGVAIDPAAGRIYWANNGA
jgi:DNA-binding beta-propeller fold protein YncE